MNQIDHMIFVFTCPRSYSSLLTKCLTKCKAFAGYCLCNHKRNPQGSYENQAIFETCFRQYSNQHNNSAYIAYCEDDYLKDKCDLLKETMTAIFNYKGYKGGAAIFKHTTFQMNYKNIISKFDKDKISIVIPKRNPEEIFQSFYKLTEGTYIDEYIADEMSAYRQNINNIINDYPEITTVINTNKLFKKDFTEIKSFVDNTSFLQWDENSVDKCIDWNIKNKKGLFGLATMYGEQ